MKSRVIFKIVLSVMTLAGFNLPAQAGWFRPQATSQVNFPIKLCTGTTKKEKAEFHISGMSVQVSVFSLATSAFLGSKDYGIKTANYEGGHYVVEAHSGSVWGQLIAGQKILVLRVNLSQKKGQAEYMFYQDGELKTEYVFPITCN